MVIVTHRLSSLVDCDQIMVLDKGKVMDIAPHATLLERQHRSTAASSLRRFLTTPEAMQLMRAPAAGVPPSRFRPPVYVTIWS